MRLNKIRYNIRYQDEFVFADTVLGVIMSKLTDTKCRTAKMSDKAYKLSDGQQMYLYVSVRGTKTFRIDYCCGGARRTLSIGQYPAISLRQARLRRDEIKQQLAMGVDPNGKPDAGKDFRSISLRWLKKKSAIWSIGHAKRVSSRLARDVFPDLGDVPIKSIGAIDVLAAVRKVEARGAVDVARQTRQTIGQIFRFAVAEGEADRNPAADLTDALAPRPPVKHHAKIPEKDLPVFFSDLYRYGREDNRTRIALELILHTFTRSKEIRFAKRSEFELDGPKPTWRIPAERMKMPREHLVPLTPRTVQLVQGMPAHDDYLFAGRNGKGVISENTMIFAIYRMGYKGRLTVHGMRGIASTVLNESGRFEPDWIEMQLAHVEGNKIRAAYNSAQWLEQRSNMMLWWSEFLERQRQVGIMLG